MNFDFAEVINPYLEKLEFEKAISIAENKLNAIPITDFHEIIGKSLSNQVEDLTDWIEKFYSIITKKNKIKSLYIEMNEFDINTDKWFLDCFAYEEDGGLNLEDMDWLCDMTVDTLDVFEESFTILGYERFQELFESVEELEEEGEFTDEMSDAYDWCEQIIIARFMELVRNAHLVAKKKNLEWAKIPIYFTEHEYEFIVKSEN